MICAVISGSKHVHKVASDKKYFTVHSDTVQNQTAFADTEQDTVVVTEKTESSSSSWYKPRHAGVPDVQLTHAVVLDSQEP